MEYLRTKLAKGLGIVGLIWGSFACPVYGQEYDISPERLENFTREFETDLRNGCAPVEIISKQYSVQTRSSEFATMTIEARLTNTCDFPVNILTAFWITKLGDTYARDLGRCCPGYSRTTLHQGESRVITRTARSDAYDKMTYAEGSFQYFYAAEPPFPPAPTTPEIWMDPIIVKHP